MHLKHKFGQPNINCTTSVGFRTWTAYIGFTVSVNIHLYVWLNGHMAFFANHKLTEKGFYNKYQEYIVNCQLHHSDIKKHSENVKS